mmetsp:Transcript_141486/g.452298  ORF Transcript_141486/g.452298 Transcript_141486/m.452298 type:complete len:140 (+) Transcript_141486:377-796(+)
MAMGGHGGGGGGNLPPRWCSNNAGGGAVGGGGGGISGGGGRSRNPGAGAGSTGCQRDLGDLATRGGGGSGAEGCTEGGDGLVLVTSEIVMSGQACKAAGACRHGTVACGGGAMRDKPEKRHTSWRKRWAPNSSRIRERS